MNARSTTPASAAATAAIVMAPRRVAAKRPNPPCTFRFCIASMCMSPLLRHDGDARTERARVAQGAAVSAVVVRVDVLDEMADEPGISGVRWRRVVTRTRIAGEAGHVEGGKALERHVATLEQRIPGRICAAIGHDEHGDQARVVRRDDRDAAV